MEKVYSFFYIPNNHTLPLMDSIELSDNIKISKIDDLNCLNKNTNSFFLLSLTGQIDLRQMEKNMVQKMISIFNTNTFFIITPFKIEAQVDLTWVEKQLDLLKDNHVNFEVFELDEYRKQKPDYTIDQVFREICNTIAQIILLSYKKG